MTLDRITVAAANNAAWCDTVCRSHGVPGAFRAGLWLNFGPVPRFYPNAVTLAGPKRSGDQLRGVGDLLAAGIAGCAVKDSFGALDLAPLGFEILFEARWVHRPASAVVPDGDDTGLHWSRLGNPADLMDWEGAWRGESDDSAGGVPASVFRPVLLGDPDIAVFAGYRDGAIVAGAVANRAAGAVGLSNVFGPAEGLDAVWAAAVSCAVAAFPGLPLVGYEAADTLALLQRTGLESLAPLRVWIRPAQSD